MRTRTRDNAVSVWPAVAATSGFATATHKCDGTVDTGTGSDGPFPAYVNHYVRERIDDTLGKGVSHSVWHKSVERQVSQIGSSWIYTSAPYGYHTYGTFTDSVMRYYSMAMASHVPEPDVNSDGVLEGWSLGLPSTDEGVILNDLKDRARGLAADVLLNLVEAGQIWPSMKNLAIDFPKALENWKRVRKLLRTGSSAYLAWKFGIGPIISDLTKVATNSSELARKYKAFTQSKPRVYSRVLPGNASYSFNDWTYTLPNGIRAVSITAGTAYGTSEKRYVLSITPEYSKYLTDAFGRLDYYCRRFSTTPARLAWELVPSSFVADWLVDMRGICDRIDGLLGSNPFKINAFTKSIKYEVQNTHNIALITGCGGTLYNGPLVTTKEKSYERINLPVTFSLRSKVRYGKSQAGITAALIAQRLPALRRG